MMKVIHVTRHKSTGGVFLIKKHSSFNDVLIRHNKKRKFMSMTICHQNPIGQIYNILIKRDSVKRGNKNDFTNEYVRKHIEFPDLVPQRNISSIAY